MTTYDSLTTLLRSLPSESFRNELDFMRKIVPSFTAILGYRETEVFYDYGSAQHRADVVYAQSIESNPWIVIEIKRQPLLNITSAISQVKHYLSKFNCKLGIVLSSKLLIVVNDEGTKEYDLAILTDEQGQEILHMLTRDAQVESIKKDISSIGVLGELIEQVELASTNEAKGKSLEAVSRFILSSVPSLTCKYANLQTRSSEIDIVVEYDPTKGRIALLEDTGRYCLIECKNWSKPVGVSPVRDFMGKLDKCKVRLGIIFSKNGVTGVDSGADALREIQSRYDRDGVLLLVFSLEDVKSIKDSRDFIAALDLKADQVRFDIGGR